MINRTEATTACALLLAGLGWAHAGSIPDTWQLCTKQAPRCPIAVRVERGTSAGSCKATVDTDRARVNSQVPVVWYLAKTSMSDTNDYEFVGDGIDWVQAASAASDFKHQPGSSAATRSQWLATAQAASRPYLEYKPRVRIHNGASCDATDPKINNDGP